MNSSLEASGRRLPLAHFNILRSNRATEVMQRMGSCLSPHHLTVHGDAHRLDVQLNRVPMGEVSIHALHYGAEVTIDPGTRGDFYLQQFAYVHLAPSMAQMAHTYAHALSGILPAEPVLVVGQPTAFDPSRAPQGHHTLWVQVRALPFTVRGDALGQIRPASWDELKALYAHRVIDVIERYAPGLRALILAQHVLSPLDLVRDNPNLVDGDSLSGSHHLDQFFLMRPAAGLSRWKTPIERLFHVGASTWPGAGTGAGSGYLLASELAP